MGHQQIGKGNEKLDKESQFEKSKCKDVLGSAG